MNKQSKKITDAREWARGVVDGLAKPIDKGIFETVVAFRAHGLTTTMSCEGHVAWGTGGPYVDLEDPRAAKVMHEFVRYKRLPQRALRAQAKREQLNMKYAEKALLLLEAFYKTRKVKAENRLVLKLLRDIRLQNQGAEINYYRPRKLRAVHLKEYQKEFAAFTKFLLRRA
jgi:hypothetical protein